MTVATSDLSNNQRLRLADALSAAVFCVAALVLIGGWGLGAEVAIRLRDDFAAMAPTTAVSFLLLSGSLLLIAPRFGTSSLVSPERKTLAGIVVAIALINLAVYVTGSATGLDQLLWSQVKTFDRGAMAPSTSLCFLLAAGATLAAHRKWAFLCLATLGLCLSGVAIVGYAFGASALYEVSIFTSMALHTALCFAALFLALLLAKPKIGWIAVLLGSGRGSAGARRLFGVVVGAPLVLCMAELVMDQNDISTPNFRLSVMVVVMTLLLATLVLRSAEIENRVEGELVGAMADLRTAVAERELLLHEVYHRVNNNLQQVDALITMQSRRIEDPKARDAFETMAGRVRALALAHRLLVGGSSPTKLLMNEFLTRLCQSIAAGHGAERRGIALELEAAPVAVEIDFAVTVGLLVNELMTNAYRHAFSETEGGAVRVRFTCDASGGAVFSVGDTGGGPTVETLEECQNAGSGLRIVQGLARQLRGECELIKSDGEGFEVRITLPSGALRSAGVEKERAA